jgi:hypothetical protein
MPKTHAYKDPRKRQVSAIIRSLTKKLKTGKYEPVKNDNPEFDPAKISEDIRRRDELLDHEFIERITGGHVLSSSSADYVSFRVNTKYREEGDDPCLRPLNLQAICA